MSAFYRPPRDAECEMPQGLTECELAVRSALGRLDREAERLARLGLQRQADACRRERRYWEFIGAVLRLEPLTALDRTRGRL